MIVKIKFSARTIIEYLLALNIILNFGTPYAHALDRDYNLPKTGVILLLILFVIRARRLRKGLIMKWGRWFIPYYIILTIYLLMRVTPDNLINFTARFMMFLPLLSILFCLDRENGEPYQLLEKYMNVMVVIAAISLPLWLLGSQLRLIKPSGSIVAYWGASTQFPSYWGLYFEQQRATILGLTNFMRNQGPFVEGPMFSLHLVMAIAVYLFLYTGQGNGEHIVHRNRKNLIKLIILATALITTFTTTGYILLALMLILKILRSMKKGSLSKYLLILFGVPILLFALIYVYQDKTWTARQNDFKIGLQAFLAHPLLGYRWNKLDLFIRQLRGLGTDAPVGFSNSIMKILAEGGLSLFSAYAVPIIGAFSKSLINKDKDFNSFMIIFLLEFIFTIFTYSFLMLMCLSVFYAYIITDSDGHQRD